MDDHGSGQLFRVAPSNLYMAAHYDWRVGWSLRVTTGVLADQETPPRRYEELSTAELLDVAVAELIRSLGLEF